MELGVSHSGLAVYRLIKGGDSGLNLRLSDLIDKEVKLPSLWEIVKTFFTRKPIPIIVKAYPLRLITKLMTIQKKVDSKIEREIEKSKRRSRI